MVAHYSHEKLKIDCLLKAFVSNEWNLARSGARGLTHIIYTSWYYTPPPVTNNKNDQIWKGKKSPRAKKLKKIKTQIWRVSKKIERKTLPRGYKISPRKFWNTTQRFAENYPWLNCGQTTAKTGNQSSATRINIFSPRLRLAIELFLSSKNFGNWNWMIWQIQAPIRPVILRE